MRTFRGIAATIVAAYLLAAVQQAWAPAMRIWGAAPDFLLLLSVCLGLLAARPKACAAGFLCGSVYGALAGASIGAYAGSRAIAAFCVSWSKALGYELGPAWVVGAVLGGSLLGQISLIVLSGASGIQSVAAATIGTALYNAVLAPPVYALLRRAIDPRKR